MTDGFRRAVYAGFGGFVIAYIAGSILAFFIASIGMYVMMTAWANN